MQFHSEITVIKSIMALFTSHVPLIGRIGQLLHKIASPFNKEKIAPLCCSTAIITPESSELQHSCKVNHLKPEIIFGKPTSGNMSLTTITAGERTLEEFEAPLQQDLD